MKLEELIGSLRTFAMKLEEEKGGKKAQGIVFQVESHAEETELICDDDDLVESIAKIIKRLNRSNRNGPRSNDPGRVSTSILTPRRNTSSNSGNFNAGSRNRSGTGNTLESNARNKGIQCRECEGFGHIQAECANTVKKKNKSLNTSDGDSDCNREDDADLVAFASRTDNAGGEGGAGSSKNTKVVPRSVPTLTYESSDNEDLTEDAMIEAYRLIHAKWTELTKSYEKISTQNQ